MKSTFLIAVCVAIVLAASIGSAEAARAIPASNETSTLIVGVSASADGGLRARTNAAFQQGNEDLRDNPPLNATVGEGVATIVYQERTMATSGSVDYNKEVVLDTGNQISPQNNLEVVRDIDFSASSDGTPQGNMLSTESVTVTECATSADMSAIGSAGGCPCPWGVQDTNQVLPSTCDTITAGSDVSVSEGHVTSDSSARTVAASVEEPVQLTYSIEVEASGQTDDDKAQGSATAYVDANLNEGMDGDSNQGTDVEYEQSTTVRGMIDLAMDVSWSSGGS
ncbi:MAG: hypothetical protein LUQ61_05975 [Methanoregulaceae archaeon]|jgi:hypothetical protein|nr:hypothetical protein [Methanoregulaceae archaeon]